MLTVSIIGTIAVLLQLSGCTLPFFFFFLWKRGLVSTVIHNAELATFIPCLFAQRGFDPCVPKEVEVTS